MRRMRYCTAKGFLSALVSARSLTCFQCTWITGSDSCDRCRRLGKKCEARESTTQGEAARSSEQDEKTIDAALTLAALSTRSEASQHADQIVARVPEDQPQPHCADEGMDHSPLDLVSRRQRRLPKRCVNHDYYQNI